MYWFMKQTLAQYAVGCKIYYDDTNHEVTHVAGGNVLAGIVVEAGAVGDEEIMIHLMGALEIVA